MWELLPLYTKLYIFRKFRKITHTCLFFFFFLSSYFFFLLSIDMCSNGVSVALKRLKTPSSRPNALMSAYRDFVIEAFTWRYVHAHARIHIRMQLQTYAFIHKHICHHRLQSRVTFDFVIEALHHAYTYRYKHTHTDTFAIIGWRHE